MGVSKMIVVVAMMVMLVVSSEALITCGQVASSIAPCLGYLQSGGPLAGTCCPGVKKLNSLASTTPDRKAACECLKRLASSNSRINYVRAGGLPGKCGVRIPYQISPSTDCTKVT